MANKPFGPEPGTRSLLALGVLLARLANTVAQSERASAWSASGLPALWIGSARKAVLREGG